MENLTPLKLAIDIWKAGRSKPHDILFLQQTRFDDLIRFVRRHSRYYAKKYSNLPENIMLQQLPPVTKSELMANFNDWVTDPEITIESVKNFVSNLSLVGQLYLRRYAVSTTWGQLEYLGFLFKIKFQIPS